MDSRQGSAYLVDAMAGAGVSYFLHRMGCGAVDSNEACRAAEFHDETAVATCCTKEGNYMLSGGSRCQL